MADVKRRTQHSLLWVISCALLVVTTSAATPSVAALDAVQRLPVGLKLPSSWTLTPVMPATDTWGLRLHLFHLDAPIAAVKRWASESRAACDASPAQPADSTAVILWLCIEPTRTYSITSIDDSLVWTVSERVQSENSVAVDSFAAMLLAVGAVQVLRTSNAFELVDVYHTSRSLVALQRDLEHYRGRHGGSLLERHQVANGLTLSWQHGAVRTHVSAIRQADGQVVVTRVTGTNL